ncbi:MAG TPA: GAF domain-containing sensor histidine kinase [Candidatus Dormibacteraeota bacterium]|nr:GAF domain-containing sensor histidine kinase [Candidatus Dormibacteraeota bacterium]
MTARSANAWWLLPGAFALVAAGVLGLLGGQLSGSAVDVGTGLVWYVAGAVAYMARPANRAARLLLLVATLLAIGKSIGTAIALASMTRPELAHDWVAVVIVDAAGWAVTAAGVAVFATFPDGKYQRPYERWIVRGLPPAFLPLVLLYLVGSSRVGTSQFGWVTLDAASPIYLHGLDPAGATAGAVLGANLLVVVPALALLLLRYRRFGADQRRQIKWPLYALSVSAISVVALSFGPGPPAIPFWIAAVQYVGTMALLPTGLALGIVMYRGLDIDDVIRRSVVYGALWALIAVIYVVVAAGFGIAVGQRVPLTLAVLLAIAATLLFQPARRRLERLADRLVFGPRLSGYERISQLGVRLQSTVAAEDVAGSVAGAVQAGLGASWVRVLLNRPEPTPIAIAGTEPGDAAAVELSAPLVQGDRVVGVIECGPKVEGRYSATDQELLNMLGLQAALAIRNSQLSAELSHHVEELAASRARLVHAEEVGRRRLERDLHDGVQQELVGVLARLGLARNQLRRDRDLAEITLREAQIDARRALEGLQELARGIHPAILTDRGLIEAVEERATRMTVPVEVHANGLGQGARFPLELEGAAYFFVSEGLANILKYASASRVHVRFHSEPGQLVIEVQDDGRGFEPAGVKKSGLRGLEDRISALGGRVEVASRPGHGTELRAYLPVVEEAHV